MILEHLPFYYQKYFKKTLNTKTYGCEDMKNVLEYLRDTVVARGKKMILTPLLPGELESLGIFVMLTEELRRDRCRLVDSGNDSAKLKFTQPGIAGMNLNNLATQGAAALAAGRSVPAVVSSAVRPPTPVASVRPATVLPAARPAFAGVARPGFLGGAGGMYQSAARAGYGMG